MGRIDRAGPFPALSLNMKGTYFLLAAIMLLPALAHAEVCRSQSTSWKSEGHKFRTEISTRADNGCKRMTYRKDDLETAGHDCNCDLIIDGREYDHKAPPSSAANPLLNICHGPEADPDSYPREGSWIEGR